MTNSIDRRTLLIAVAVGLGPGAARQAGAGDQRTVITEFTITIGPEGSAHKITVSLARTTRRGLWVWNYAPAVVGSDDEENILLNECIKSSITDLYCFVTEELIRANAEAMRRFNARANALGIRCWGLDGDRDYFSDGSGLFGLNANIDAVIAFNAASNTAQKFCGFQIDNEPPDTGSFRAFHNGIASSALSSIAGSGVWQSTATLDREYLMRDWVEIHRKCKERCANAELLFASALPTWFDDYFGEPITCTYDHSDAAGPVSQNMFLHLARYIDVICVMSYVTSTVKLIDRIRYEAEAATAIPTIQIGNSIETVAGVGQGISYGDTKGKQTKAAALADLNAAAAMYSGHPAYSWTNIHDWSGWKTLSPASTDTSIPVPGPAIAVESVRSIAQAAAVGTVIGRFSGGRNYKLSYDPSGCFEIVMDELRVARTPLKAGNYRIQVTSTY